MWIHQSHNAIPVGELVLPSTITGITSSYGAGRADAIARGQLDPDSVSVMWVEAEGNIGTYSFTGPFWYEVEPRNLRPDPDPTALPGWAICADAMVVRCLCSPQ